jgi:hypothetical protein
LDDVNEIVTDDGITEAWQHVLESAGLRVEIVRTGKSVNRPAAQPAGVV